MMGLSTFPVEYLHEPGFFRTFFSLLRDLTLTFTLVILGCPYLKLFQLPYLFRCDPLTFFLTASFFSPPRFVFPSVGDDYPAFHQPGALDCLFPCS